MHKTNALSELQGELELLESETFEVLDLVEAAVRRPTATPHDDNVG